MATFWQLKELSIDLETYSDVNISKCGAYKYAESDNFEILLFGVSVDGSPIKVYDLACGDTGTGKMPEPEVLYEHILQCCAYKKDMSGMKVMVTAGPTQEAIDPVRYITNHSSGKMGYSIARACALRGADVTLITGKPL